MVQPADSGASTGSVDAIPASPALAVRRTLDPWVHQGVVTEPERAADGSSVPTATIFLTGRTCPWHCVMCDLWQYTTETSTPRGAIPVQIDRALAEVRERGASPHTLKLYNAGSFFDRQAVPVDDDAAIVEAVTGIPRVIVESHPSLVGTRAWRLREALARQTAGARLEVAMGLETAHPAALAAIDKGITRESFARAAEALRAHDIDLRVFLLLDPPFVPAAEQVSWMAQSVAFAIACGATVVTLIPTRLGNAPLHALAERGEFAPPTLRRIETVAAQVLARRDNACAVRVFVDTWDLERFAACPACASSRRDRLIQMNHAQRVLPAIACDVCGEVTPA